MRQVGAPCIVVSLFSYYRYCWRMLQLALHSLGMGALVSPEASPQVRAMLSRRVTTPWTLMAAAGPTIRSDCRPNLSGAKLDTTGVLRFERPYGEG